MSELAPHVILQILDQLARGYRNVPQIARALGVSESAVVATKFRYGPDRSSLMASYENLTSGISDPVAALVGPSGEQREDDTDLTDFYQCPTTKSALADRTPDADITTPESGDEPLTYWDREVLKIADAADDRDYRTSFDHHYNEIDRLIERVVKDAQQAEHAASRLWKLRDKLVTARESA